MSSVHTGCACISVGTNLLSTILEGMGSAVYMVREDTVLHLVGISLDKEETLGETKLLSSTFHSHPPNN